MIENKILEFTSLKIVTILDFLQSTVLQTNDTPWLDAQVLMSNVIEKPRSWILAHPEAQITPVQEDRLTKSITQLEVGVPLPYVIGHWEFYNLDFKINPHVLIPRPETELMVDVAIKWLQANPHYRCAADIGTGSGCISISLAHHIPNLKLIATDISLKAIDVARANAIKHGVADRITLIQADLLPPSKKPFSLICANLPYIPSTTLHTLEVFGREPSLALDGGLDGLELIRRLIFAVPDFLAPGGILLTEIEANQGKTAIELANKQFPDSEVILISDHSGRDRLLQIQT